ncbi:uncharacterized protein LOC105229156 [Bactrocera dorsalis]|uniref:Regulatory protein zeste n=1 Tax=Bactrocera dorsalis TaxID=27457 RepID=A0A6I9VD70_BACDO|nr:uncharacterized protein LOC105229156 [Bactrocera dorsalis]
MVNKQYTATDLEAFMKLAVNWQNSNHNLLEGVDIKGEMQQYMNSPAMNMYKKRERTQNWNHQEKKFLLELCRKDMRIIENKRLDAGLTAVKNKAWKIIHQKFSSQFGTDRTCNRLKEQWRRMKACTRNEILDYNNRLGRFGAEVADRKKPSPFTFEVWEFMQEAKKACKSEALDGIDYSKIPLALEEDYEYREDEQNGEDDHDMDDSRTPPQELCDVDIKEETNETFNDTNTHNDSMALGERLSSSSPNLSRLGAHHDLERVSLHSPAGNMATANELANSSYLSQNGASGSAAVGGSAGDMGAFQPAFNMSNISATLEALNALRTGQFPSAAAAAAAALQNNFAAAAAQQQQHQQLNQQQPQQQQMSPRDDQPLVKRPRSSSGSANGEEVLHDLSMNGAAAAAAANVATVNTANAPISASNGVGMSALGASPSSTPEMRAFMEMQSKEHLMRMKILEVQLQAAKYNRDLVEINKTLALQKLQELASKRLTS